MTCGDFQGNVTPPRFSPSRSIRVRPRKEKLPNQSIARTPSTIPVSGLCTSKEKKIRTNAILATGKLIQNTHLQLTYWEKAPPSKGPIPAAKAHMSSIKPRYRLRCLLETSILNASTEILVSYLTLNISEMMIVTIWSKPPPATPCKARPTMRILIIVAVAHKIEVRKKRPIAKSKRGFRPQISESLAQIHADAAFARRYAPRG